MLKEYFDRCDQTSVKSVSTLANVETLENCTENEISVDSSEKDFSQSVRLKNSEILANLDTKLGHLNSHQREQIQQLMASYPSIFMDVPKKTTAACHDVIVGDFVPIKQHPYRVNPLKLQHLRSEVKYMLDQAKVTGAHHVSSYLNLMVLIDCVLTFEK